MESTTKAHSRAEGFPGGFNLMELPDSSLICVLEHLDGKSLNAIAQTCRWFSRNYAGESRVCEAVAKRRLLDMHGGSLEAASRFRNYSWRERLFIEEDAPAWFDMRQCEVAGVQVQPGHGKKSATVKLVEMGPKILLSDVSTADQPILRWRLRVTGNTALELGVVPACLEVSNNSLHKADSVRGSRTLRCTGFSSQITAGSHLPVKIPVVRGTIVDLMASRGLVQVILFYPSDAQEIKWNREGHPVPAPYQGPRVLRFELEFSESYDVKLACTCWAKASFDILHKQKQRETPQGAVLQRDAERSLSVDYAPMDVEDNGQEAPSPKTVPQRSQDRDMCNSMASTPSSMVSSQSLG
eukprot:CAMPEP_0182607824 /NCGR_PEP_ID=MMETSP1330-20130603/2413_1 /TAXON_ID=464278 /ORGANISM="Picochlorum sp., Strain RCC944" /LENGTH=353 /DNA_ID=CAMNT_0024826483 /DNA_START=340 /DNA_END=1401 /DNA_ORIENTATION=+